MRKRHARRGQVIVMIAIMMFFLFGLAGLSVDMIYAYAVKARLVTAVDAAALAAARALSQGTNPISTQQIVNQVVDKYFAVNFPQGLLLSTRSYDAPVITSNSNSTRTVQISARAVVPTFFLRAAGYSTLPVAAMATSMRRDVNIVLVLDRSGSLMLVSPPAWDDVQAAAKFFIDQFDDQRDRLGVVSFGTGARIDLAPSTNFKTRAKNLIDMMACYSGNRTNSPYGMWTGYQALAALPASGALNVVVLFTDGQPTAYTNNFPVRTSGSVYCSVTPKTGVYMTDQDGGIGSIWGLFQTLAPPAPTGNPDRTIVTACPGLNSSGSNVTSLVTSLPNEWRPNGTATTPVFSFTGPKAVSTTALDSGDNVQNIGYNLTLRVAEHIRTTLSTRIFSIGLGGYMYPADDVLLEAVANDPTSTSYNPTQPAGLYVYAPDQTELQGAFQRVSSEISRLIQ